MQNLVWNRKGDYSNYEKIMSVAIAFVMMLSIFSVPAMAAESEVTIIATDFESENEDSLTIVEYDYSTKEETTSTLYLDTLKNNNASRAASMNISAGEISEAYIPVGLEVASQDSITSRSADLAAWGPIGNSNVNVYPYTAVLAMKMGWENEDGEMDWYLGTGFLEGYDVVATAGHNMWDGTYGWVDDCRFYVRQNSSIYSEEDFYYPKQWVCASNYTSNMDEKYDWCAITLWDNLGSANGWFGKGWSENKINNKLITMSGYPLWYGKQYSGGAETSSSTAYVVRYNMVVPQGTSGSPIYDSNYIVWAIQSRGYSSTKDQGARITEFLYNILQDKYLEGAEIYGN